MRRDSFNVLFFIKKTKLLKNGEASVCMRITVNGARVETNIRKSIEPVSWNQAKECARGKSRKSTELNNYIEESRIKLHRIYTQLEENGELITARILQEKFFGVDKKVEQVRTIIGTMREHNEQCRALVGKDFALITVRRYESCTRYLAELIKLKYDKEDLPITEVNGELVRAFEFYLKTEKNCQQNTVIRYMKCLKKIINLALANEWIEKNPFAGIKFHEKEVVAFLNYKEGGYIYIGIDKDGSTVGVNDVDDCMLRLKDRIKHNVSPSAMGLFDIAEEQKDGCSIIKVTVASGIEKPYFKTKYGMTPRGAYMRVGTSAEPMPQEQIDRLFAMRTRNSIGRIVSNRQDLSFEQLRIYYDERGKRLNDNFKRTLELLTDDGKYNYVAYLLADENGNSIKVAKYSSLDRCDLVENNEYGYCSLIKATKSVLSKLDIENKVAATITPMERIETPLWNKVALREAVINAIVHNDYSFEVPPKFEIFPNRLEITSAGRLPESLTKEEFFNGISIPRNKELMRIYRDVELVESLGSGIPRILRAYGEDCFKFTDNFIRITLPISAHEGTKSAPSRH